ncbi:MAG TPA: NBR1-Ig-like domain-containing protein [Levilinea sp.]|nr:NBR1-Ig-like domain-containing protein [Levilinea sp.]
MKRKLFSVLNRVFLIMMVLTLFGAMAPRSVQAADGFYIDIVSVKSDTSVTIRYRSAPANNIFTVRMDVAGNKAINGIVVAETNAGAGGNFEETYKIPAELHGKKTIAIRVDSTRGGFYAFNWFNNVTSTAALPSAGTSQPIVTGRGPAVKILGIKGDMMTVRATGFPADVTFSVRVGPFYGFARQGEVMGTVHSGKGGDFNFNVKISSRVKANELGAIRLDGGGYFAYNAFKYVDSGTFNTDAGIPKTPSVGMGCQVVSASPNTIQSMSPNNDFDGVWQLKNTGSKNWDLKSIDYKYISGAKIYKHDAIYDLPKTVKPGETIKIVVDMIAPSTSGVYTTHWALVEGSATLCNMSISIKVK